MILKRNLKDEFLWLRWNWVTTKNSLSQLPLVDIGCVDWSKPTYTTLHEADRDQTSSALSPPSAGGVAVTSPESVVAAERLLVANSGKLSDGFDTSFNRRLCRPPMGLCAVEQKVPSSGFMPPFRSAFQQHFHLTLSLSAGLQVLPIV